MNSKEIFDRLLDRVGEQAVCIGSQREALDRLKREAAQAAQAQNTIARLERDLRDHRERIKAVEATFNAWRASSPKMRPPPAFLSAMDLLVTEDIPF